MVNEGRKIAFTWAFGQLSFLYQSTPSPFSPFLFSLSSFPLSPLLFLWFEFSLSFVVYNFGPSVFSPPPVLSLSLFLIFKQTLKLNMEANIARVFGRQSWAFGVCGSAVHFKNCFQANLAKLPCAKLPCAKLWVPCAKLPCAKLPCDCHFVFIRSLNPFHPTGPFLARKYIILNPMIFFFIFIIFN